MTSPLRHSCVSIADTECPEPSAKTEHADTDEAACPPDLLLSRPLHRNAFRSSRGTTAPFSPMNIMPSSPFEGLSKDAQCLLIRMINRRGSVFNRHLFKYAEISDVEAAASDLMSCGHARGLRVDDFAAFLACLPKTILIQGAKAAGFSDVRTSWPKPKLIEFFLAQIDFDVALEFCGGERFIALDNTRADRAPALSLFRQDRRGSQEFRVARSRHHSYQQTNLVQRAFHGCRGGPRLFPL